VRLIQLFFHQNDDSEDIVRITVSDLVGVARGQCVMTLTP